MMIMKHPSFSCRGRANRLPLLIRLNGSVCIKGITCFVLTALMLGVYGCKSKKEKSPEPDVEMARGSYNVEKNTVTVIPLERTVFNKQLL